MRRYLSIFIAIAIACGCKAQITHNHDESFMQQFLFTETGEGGLTPDFYYDLFHKSYRNNYMGQGKLVFRGQMTAAYMMEKPYAEDLDSALTKRAKVEALNVADRQPFLDAAWAVEGPKIQKKMNVLFNSIQNISIYGGKQATSDMFQLKYDMLDQAIESVREAYMPTSERKDQYLAIYNDVLKVIGECDNVVLYLKSCRLCEELKKARKIRRVNNVNIAVQAHGRWRTNLVQASGGNSGIGGNGNGISAD